jgi:hypothetical protein
MAQPKSTVQNHVDVAEAHVKPYLEYLDKEMTIMGILSGFCVTVAALVLDRLAGARVSSDLGTLWSDLGAYVATGSACLVVAAFFFYRQRSHLAWIYGQLCLSVSPYQPGVTPKGWLREADSWGTWLSYRWGFAFTALAFLDYGVAVIAHWNSQARGWALTATCLLAATLLGAYAVNALVLRRHTYCDSPWADVFGGPDCRRQTKPSEES